ncbi:MAG: peroxidase, partial [Planctomycetaceae bacterium]|nr:peroxidase [Planctomycetaceae bacterium]
MLSATSSPIDGSGNNQANPDWGSTGTELLRLTSPDYTDGVSSPAGQDRPSARVVSNAIAAQTDSILNSRNLTDYIWAWGQFLDHDIDLSDSADPAETLSIEVPVGDPWFDPFATGTVTIDTVRSKYVIGSDSSDGLRQQLNSITAFIDGSVVYGSDQTRADALRTFSGGQLRTSAGDLLPFNVDGLPNANGTSATQFLAGDVRANENVLLTSMQTLWVREHNRIASELAAADASLTDQQLYEQARSIVAAEIQAITYNEFLPALLGPDAISAYSGYDSGVNSGIANEFSTAAYRFGHSLLSPQLQQLDSNWQSLPAGPLPLQNAFFNPSYVTQNGIDALLRGAAVQTAQELDTFVVDDVRNFLFGPPGAGGLDLASLNIMRGREHGLGDYNQTRQAMGLPAITNFSQISTDPETVAALQDLYGSVDNIDLWVGGLAEDHLPESSMGATFTAILVDQFTRLRDGDRYWYQNIFSGQQLQTIDNTTLADVILRNSSVGSLQTNVFFAPGSETVYVNPAEHGLQSLEIREQNGRIVVTDVRGRQILLDREIGDIGGIVILGSDSVREQIGISAGINDLDLPFGVDVRGGVGADSFIIRGTGRDDTIIAGKDFIDANTLHIVFSDVDELLIEGQGGNDLLDASAAMFRQLTIDGGRGNDRIIGSRGDDRLFGDDG